MQTKSCRSFFQLISIASQQKGEEESVSNGARKFTKEKEG